MGGAQRAVTIVRTTALVNTAQRPPQLHPPAAIAVGWTSTAAMVVMALFAMTSAAATVTMIVIAVGWVGTAVTAVMALTATACAVAPKSLSRAFGFCLLFFAVRAFLRLQLSGLLQG